MRLLGTKEFLRTVKPGTLCVEFWLDNEKECGPFQDETDQDAWALKILEESEYYKNDAVVNYKGEKNEIH